MFAQYTPIFIGYGGNDDSLMDLLESLDPGEIKGQMIWCYYVKGEKPGDRIKELVAQHRGALVPVPDFDVLMVLLGAEMGIKPLDNVLAERARNRTTLYQERILGMDTTAHPDVATALAATFERAGGWWAWELKTRAELDSEKCEAIYRQGIEQFPDSWELHGNFAVFMTDVRHNPGEAERLYHKALELNPQDANHTGNFGGFLVGRDRADEALPLLQRAWTLNQEKPNQASAEVTLYMGIIERCTACDDNPALGRLKTLLLDSFRRLPSSFDLVLEFAKAKLSQEDHALYSALAGAIFDV